LYEPENAAAALREYASILPTLPRTVGWHAIIKPAMPALPFVPPERFGKPLLALLSMWLDDANDPAGDMLIERLTHIGKPCHKVSEVLPFAAGVQQMTDHDLEHGHRYYTKEVHMSQLTDGAIDVLMKFWKNMPAPMQGEVVIFSLGGAMADPPEDSCAFSGRQYLNWLNFALRWDDPIHDSDFMTRAREVGAELAPWAGTGIYVNMLNVDEMDRVVEGFGGAKKYAELGRIKAQYDPHNLFRENFNIVPNLGQ
jgi:hypothetical protein